MTGLPGRLGELRARDVMTKSVIVVRQSDDVATAVEVLKSHHITGTPVVDETGRLVGIFSISDVVNRDGAPSEADVDSEPFSDEAGRTASRLFDRAVAIGEEQGESTVRDRMSTTVRSVPQDASLVDVARAMCDGHWHRVPVIDDCGALQGIISTMDVLAAVKNAADEARL
ncbi:MAG: HPP family protein [Planctomycetaceae bacterium]